MADKAFPNPLQLTVDSHILVSQFEDSDGATGILFRQTGADHKTGDLYPDEMLELPHRPEPGELYLRFRSTESAVVVLEALSQVLCHLSGFPKRLPISRKAEPGGEPLARLVSRQGLRAMQIV